MNLKSLLIHLSFAIGIVVTGLACQHGEREPVVSEGKYFFPQALRRDANAQEKKYIAKLYWAPKGILDCTAFFLENNADKMILATAAHCVGFDVLNWCRQGEEVGGFVDWEGKVGWCENIIAINNKNDLFVFEARYDDGSPPPARQETLKLATFVPPVNTKLKVYGFPADDLRNGTATVTENCWITEADAPSPPFQVSDRSAHHNCTVYFGNSGGPMVIEGTRTVVGMPTNYIDYVNGDSYKGVNRQVFEEAIRRNNIDIVELVRFFNQLGELQASMTRAEDYVTKYFSVLTHRDFALVLDNAVPGITPVTPPTRPPVPEPKPEPEPVEVPDNNCQLSRKPDRFIWPVPDNPSRWAPVKFDMSSNPFGCFSDANCHGHRGVDIFAKQGSQVVAMAGGQVVHRGEIYYSYNSQMRAMGENVIVIKHWQGFYSVYAHHGSPYVDKGNCVKPGQVIATIGPFFNEQPHLHLEVLEYNRGDTFIVPYLKGFGSNVLTFHRSDQFIKRNSCDNYIDPMSLTFVD